MPLSLSPVGARRIAVLAVAGGALVATAVVASIFLATARDSWTAVASAGPAGPADGILLLAGLGGALLSLWLGLGLTLSALSALPGALGQVCRALAARIAPAAVRKVVAFVLGTTLTAALIPGNAAAGISHETHGPAVVAAANHVGGSAAKHVGGSLADAAPDASFRYVSEPPPNTSEMDAAPLPLWSLDKVAPPQPPAKPDRPATSSELMASARFAPAIDRIVVHRGDTLWSIAARHLGPDATSADIDLQWRRWFAANRAVIGTDASLILPGQLLRPPPSPGPDS